MVWGLRLKARNFASRLQQVEEHVVLSSGKVVDNHGNSEGVAPEQSLRMHVYQ